MTRKTLIIISSALVSPLLVFGAYNDVELVETNAVLTVNSANLTVSGGSALLQSITVNGTDFSVTLPANSHIQVTSTDKRIMTSPEAGSVRITSSCSTASNVFGLENPSGGETVTMTVTVSSDACTSGGGGGSSGGSGGGGGGSSSGGGGGGGSATPAVPATPTVAPATPAVPSPSAQPSSVARMVSPVFNRALIPSARHSDVKRLQQLLNSDPDTMVSALGAGSSGKETDLFGPATVKALKKFQVKYKVAKPGDVGYGNFGPKTRAKMKEVFGETSAALPAVPAMTREQLVQSLLDQLKALQAKLDAMKKAQ